MAAADDSVTAALKLAPTTIKFTRPDGLTVTATATFTPASATTGTQAHGLLRTQSAENVAFSNVKLQNTIALPTPATCRLAQPAIIALTSGDGVFDLGNGGALTGTATLGRLTSCAAFGALVGSNLGTVTDLSVTATPVATA